MFAGVPSTQPHHSTTAPQHHNIKQRRSLAKSFLHRSFKSLKLSIILLFKPRNMYSKTSDSLFSEDEPSISPDEKNSHFEVKPEPKYSVRALVFHRIASFLVKISFPFAIISGCAITAGTTYALVRWVQHLISTAAVNSNPVVWMQAARTNAYDACYYGCNGCSDTWWAYNACAMTARANVTGVICDGNKLWNWKERYPLECLAAVGEFYKADALRNLKKSYRNRLAIIILTIIAGFLGSVIVYLAWKKITISLEERARINYENSRVWLTKKRSTSDLEKRSSSTGKSPRKFALLGGLAIFSGKSNAYPCTGYNAAVDQYFENANKKIFGTVHGYLSDCYDYTCDCVTTCGGGSMPSCTTSCSTCTAVRTVPTSFVHRVIPKVQSCGFVLADAVEGDVNLRVANALIERNWWVKISVNTYNVTEETDPSIMCLHAIGA
jgi:hypothetical protein